MFDFPNSPTLNQTVPMPDGTMRRWDGTKWVAYGVATTPPVVVGDTPPSNPQPGWLWWDSVGGQLYLWFIDAGGPPGQWVPTTNQAAGVPDAPTDGTAYTRRNGVWTPNYAANNLGRNFAINGQFWFWQRGGGPFTANGNRTADRWTMWFNGGIAMSVQIQGLGTPGIAAIGDEAAQIYLQAIVTGAAGANCGINQQIEGIRRLSGKTLMCSFWACASAAGLKLGVGAWLNMGTGGSPSAGPGGLPGTAVTLGLNWVRYSVPITVPSMSGQTFGTNGNDTFELDFYMCDTGTSYSGGVGNQSGQFYIYGVQLEVGTVATPLEKPDLSYQLQQCERYYQVLSGVLFGGWLEPGINMWASFPLRTYMRAQPTVTINQTGGTPVISLNAANANTITLQLNRATSPGGVDWAAANVFLSAEL